MDDRAASEQPTEKRTTLQDAQISPSATHLCLCGCNRPVIKRRANHVFHDTACRMRFWTDKYARIREDAKAVEERAIRMMQERQRDLYDQPMTETEHLILGHLESHKGRENAIAA